MVVITTVGKDVLVLFSVDQHGVAKVSAFELDLRFHFKPKSIHVDEEIFLSKSGLLSHTIGHILVIVGEDVWNMKQGKYMVYRVRTSDHIPSKDRVTFNWSSSLSFRTPSPSHVKIESATDNVIVLNSNSNANSPEVITVRAQFNKRCKETIRARISSITF